MVWTGFQFIVAILFVITGSINTISAKWADRQEAEGRDGVVRHFVHPFFQALCMFMGEILCFIVFKTLYCWYNKKDADSVDTKTLTKGNRDFNRFILMLPAVCDMSSTSVIYVGLNLTYASSYQMLCGSVIIFVGLLSVAFLGRVLKLHHWFGMFFVITGLALVGLADFVGEDTSGTFTMNKYDVTAGDLLIVIAEILTAMQLVIEEKFIAGLDIPALHAAGWEGIFGSLMMSVMLVPLYFIPVGPPFSDNSRGVLEDVIEAFVQIANSWQLLVANITMIFSIAIYNFSGISVTKELSATTRVIMDSLRTIIVWAFSLVLFEQKFYWLQVLSFVVLIFGMCLYNGITCKGTYLCLKRLKNSPPEEEEANRAQT